MSEYGQPNPPQFHQAPKPPKRPMSKEAKIGWGIFAGLGAVALVATALIPGNASDTAQAPTAVTSQAGTPVDNGPTPDPIITPTNKPQPSPKVTHKPAPTTTKPAAPKLTAGQEQAVGAAQDYLSIKAFSRKGLIEQLSSEYGEGFSVKDATFAVDYLKVDWNAQAAAKAKEYLATQHFSRKGLIQQLDSAYGEQFTHAQAVYGVSKAGL